MQAGERVGPYEILERLGRGGFGEVWKGRHTRLGRAVAIKFLQGRRPEEVVRFRREARLLAALAHPHIAALYEFEDDPTRPLLVMQYVEGVPLDRAPLTLPAKIRALAEAARAIHYAHERGILHRDLKPANLLADEQGHGIVLDFGLARDVRPEPGVTSAHLTLAGDIFGTPAYMPPEQARGEVRALDRRSDVYALGATLYTILAGVAPFRGETPFEVIDQVLTVDPPPPAGPRELRSICQKAMEKDPARRYPTAADLAADLERHLAGEPIRARPTGLMARWARRARRRPVVWGLGGLLAASVLAAAGLVGALSLRERIALTRQLDEERLQAESLAREARGRTEERARQERLSLLHQATHRLRRLDERLSRELEDAPLAAVRDEVEALLAGLGDAERRFPDEGGFLYLRSRALRLLGRDDEALVHLGRAVERPGRHAALAAYERFRVGLDRLFGRLAPASPARFHTALGDAREDQLRALREDAERIQAADLPDLEGRLLDLTRRFLLERVDEAIAEAGREIERGGETADLYALRARMWLWRQEYARAAADAEEAVARHAGRASFHGLAGNAYLGLGEWDRARQAYDRALRLRPGDLWALVNRGIARAQADDPEGAIADFEEALRTDPSLAAAWHNLAEAHVDQGDLERAIGEFGESIQRGGGWEPCLNRAKVWAQLGKLDESEADLRQALEAMPADSPRRPEAERGLEWIQRQRGR